MFFKSTLSWLIAAVIISTSANAALVSPTTSAYASFDVSGLTPGEITGFATACIPSCPLPEGDNSVYAIPAFGNFLVNFGTSAGSDDIGSRIFYNPFPMSVAGIQTTTSGSFVSIPDGISTIFATIIFVDSVFKSDEMKLFIDGQLVATSMTQEISASEVPLPAALYLFLAGIAGVGAATRHKRQLT